MRKHPFRENVISRFKEQWSRPRPKDAEQVVQFLVDVYDRFCDAGLADNHFERELTNGNASTYAQRVAELLLADMLWNDGFELSSSSTGPDFKALKNGKSAWIELITPEPCAALAEFLELDPSPLVRRVPHEEINLRWTSAISEKAQKLLGDRSGKKAGYIAKGIVHPDDSFILAVNARLLERSPSGGLYGISQFPAPIEVLFGVGPIEVVISRETGDIEGQHHQHRPKLLKRKTGSEIPADSFLDSRYAPISAVLGLSLCESKPLGNEHFSELVHNPLALNPIASDWLAAQQQWKCEFDADHYKISPLE